MSDVAFLSSLGLSMMYGLLMMWETHKQFPYKSRGALLRDIPAYLIMSVFVWALDLLISRGFAAFAEAVVTK